jgi:hypothetical protein
MPQPIGRIPGLSEQTPATVDTRTWGDSQSIVPATGITTHTTKQLVKADWPEPTTWTVLGIVDFTGITGFAAPGTVTLEIVLGVGYASHTLRRVFTGLAITDQVFDSIAVPAKSIQGRIIIATNLGAPTTGTINATMLVAPRVYNLDDMARYTGRHYADYGG